MFPVLVAVRQLTRVMLIYCSFVSAFSRVIPFVLHCVACYSAIVFYRFACLSEVTSRISFLFPKRFPFCMLFSSSSECSFLRVIAVDR